MVHLLGKVQEQDRVLTYAPLESREFCSPKSTEMLKEWIREQAYNDCDVTDVVKTRRPLNHPKPNPSGRFWGAGAQQLAQSTKTATEEIHNQRPEGLQL